MMEDADTILETLRRHDLPFVVEEEDGERHFWCAFGSGQPAADFALGETYAEMALKAAKESSSPFLLAVVLRDMVRTGEFGPLEAGFLATVASVAKAGAMN